MSNLLEEQIKKGRKTQCAISGLWFYRSEMEPGPQGQWIYPKFRRNDDRYSEYEKGSYGNGQTWERRY